MPRSFRRFFVDSDFSPDQSSLQLSERETYHLQRVLRLKSGDHCRLFNRKGREALAKIESLSETGGARLKLEEIFPRGGSPHGDRPRKGLLLKIGQALPQKGKMEDLVEKAEELGVHELWVLETERTVVKMKAEARERARNRWERIVIEAAKQSGNPVLAEIHGPLPFRKVLAEALRSSDRAFLFHPDPSGIPFPRVVEEIGGKQAGPVFLFFGPEGGFTEKEVGEAEAKGIRKVFLGENVLRLDTAFIGAVSALRFMVC